MGEFLELIEFGLAIIGFLAILVFLENHFRDRRASQILKSKQETRSPKT